MKMKEIRKIKISKDVFEELKSEKGTFVLPLKEIREEELEVHKKIGLNEVFQLIPTDEADKPRLVYCVHTFALNDNEGLVLSDITEEKNSLGVTILKYFQRVYTIFFILLLAFFSWFGLASILSTIEVVKKVPIEKLNEVFNLQQTLYNSFNVDLKNMGAAACFILFAAYLIQVIPTFVISVIENKKGVKPNDDESI